MLKDHRNASYVIPSPTQQQQKQQQRRKKKQQCITTTETAVSLPLHEGLNVGQPTPGPLHRPLSGIWPHDPSPTPITSSSSSFVNKTKYDEQEEEIWNEHELCDVGSYTQMKAEKGPSVTTHLRFLSHTSTSPSPSLAHALTNSTHIPSSLPLTSSSHTQLPVRSHSRSRSRSRTRSNGRENNVSEEEEEKKQEEEAISKCMTEKHDVVHMKTTGRRGGKTDDISSSATDQIISESICIYHWLRTQNISSINHALYTPLQLLDPQEIQALSSSDLARIYSEASSSAGGGRREEVGQGDDVFCDGVLLCELVERLVRKEIKCKISFFSLSFFFFFFSFPFFFFDHFLFGQFSYISLFVFSSFFFFSLFICSVTRPRPSSSSTSLSRASSLHNLRQLISILRIHPSMSLTHLWDGCIESIVDGNRIAARKLCWDIRAAFPHTRSKKYTTSSLPTTTLASAAAVKQRGTSSKKKKKSFK